MRVQDFARLVVSSLVAHRLRSSLTALGVAIGVAAVVLLTSMGEGLHRFVLAEFSQFGTSILAINPGRVTTSGTPAGIFASARPLTLDDAMALERIDDVEALVPLISGNVEVEGGARRRRTSVYGVGPALPRVFQLAVGAGRFLPEDDPRAPRALAVLGSRLRTELFGDAPALGRRVRIGGQRYRVIGTMAPKGQVLGFDLNDSVYIPAARALQLFDREGLMEIDLLYRPDANVDRVISTVSRRLIARHGLEDFTLTTQQQMLDVLGNILRALTFAVAALGGISLLVGAVGILTIMTIAVRERKGEIGLLRALGAEQKKILLLFLAEAAALASLGGGFGLAVGLGTAGLLDLLVPALPIETAWTYVLAAELIAISVGLLAGVLPALRASRLDPVEALRAE